MGEHLGIDRLLQVIQMEYRENPALNLTKPQMQRLWGFDAPVCNALVDALVNTHVLRRTLRDSYVLQGSNF
jgi:hypothetical protein